jgi:hypothetical protein
MKYISNSPIPDGLGSRVCKILNLIGHSIYNNENLPYGVNRCEFIYTPLALDLGNSFYCNATRLYAPFTDNSAESYKTICTEWDKILGYKGKTIYDVDPSSVEFLIHPPGDANKILTYTGLKRKEIRSLFDLKEVKTNFIKVAVHIRRADVDKKTHPDRFTEYSYYINAISHIKRLLGNSCELIIYTQRHGFNSELFPGITIKYDDETKDHESWMEMVNSDILVIGKSSYSYSAGLLSTGIVVYHDMFHPKVYNWIYINDLETAITNKY